MKDNLKQLPQFASKLSTSTTLADLIDLLSLHLDGPSLLLLEMNLDISSNLYVNYCCHKVHLYMYNIFQKSIKNKHTCWCHLA